MIRRVTAVAVFAGVLVAGGAAQALECPAAQTLGTGSAALTSAAFSEKYAADKLYIEAPKIVASLRSQFPNARTGEIMDFLIAAFCPKVAADKEASDADKHARIRAYASWVSTILY